MTEVTPVMVVDRMLEILAKPENWTKREFARNAKGESVRAESLDACSLCLSGARIRAQLTLGAFPIMVLTAMSEEADVRGFEYSVANFNDSPQTKHIDILDYLKAVRTRLEATCTA